MHTPVLFEHPLNEKMRTWLRIEFLIQQMAFRPQIASHADALHFFRNAGDLLDVLERGEVRTDLVKELERQQRKLQSWAEVPGVDQEHAGVIRHGAKVLYAYSEATVPKITVILRKAYGGGYIAMNSRHLGADFMFAWPSAEIAVMGPEGAANIIFRKEIMEAEDQNAMRQEKVKEYIEKFANPYVAASKGFIDSVIEPKETRSLLLHALKLSILKEEYRPAKKHGLPPF